MLNKHYEQQFKKHNKKGGGVLIDLHPLIKV